MYCASVLWQSNDCDVMLRAGHVSASAEVLLCIFVEYLELCHSFGMTFAITHLKFFIIFVTQFTV